MLKKSSPGLRNPEFHITSIDCIDCLLNYRQSSLFGIKWLIGTSEALENRCKMNADQEKTELFGQCVGQVFSHHQF